MPFLAGIGKKGIENPQIDSLELLQGNIVDGDRIKILGLGNHGKIALYKTEKDNPNYIFYTDDELKGKNEGNNFFRNFDLLLNQRDNFCPNCKNFSLDFQTYIFC